VLPVDSNRVAFKDDSGVFRAFPYESAWTITFNTPLVGAGSSFRMMFTAPPGAGNDYGESGAVTVNDAQGVPISGVVTAGTLSGSYDYDGNSQSGFTSGTDRPVTIVGVRPGYGKYAVATGVLTRSKNISFSLVAEQDRVYTA
jgi:hypothetical protein